MPADENCAVELDVIVTTVYYFRVIRVRIQDIDDNAPRFADSATPPFHPEHSPPAG